MITLLLLILRRYWLQVALGAGLLALYAVVHIQHRELNHDKAKLAEAVSQHALDVARINALGTEITDQNAAISNLQAQQAAKQAQASKALADAQAHQKTVRVLLQPTEGKTAQTCVEAMPSIRDIVKGLKQ